MKVQFYASGYCTAAEHNVEIQDNGDEIVAYTKDGEEVARWIIM